MDMLSEHTYTPSPSSAAIPTEPQSKSNGTALGGNNELEERHSLQPQQAGEEEEEDEEGLESAMALPLRPESQNLSSVVLPVLDQVSPAAACGPLDSSITCRRFRTSLAPYSLKNEQFGLAADRTPMDRKTV